MPNPLLWRSLLPFLSAMVALSAAQTSPADSTKMPADSRELLLLASRSSDLTVEGVKPWHAKATYRLMDDQGNVTDEGTYEELWAEPSRFKRTYAGKGYTQTDTSAIAGVMRTGQREDVSRLLFDMRRELVTPLPNARSLGDGPFAEKQVNTGGSDLRCIFLRDPARVPAYCIASDQAILRMTVWSGQGIQILHNRILRFQGKYIPGDLEIVREGKTILTAHLESIEVLDAVKDSDFAASSDAVFVPMRVNISGGVAVGMIEHKVNPEFPAEAQAKGMQGTVVLEAVIGVDGKIKELNVVTGAPVFQKPALDAVRRWRYRPYLLNGVPVEVKTTINVVFSLGE